MTDTPRRVFGVLCVMVALWIATYWLYEPAAWEPKVTLGETPADLLLTEPPPGIMEQPAPPSVSPPPALIELEPATVVVPPPPKGEPRLRVEPPAFREYTVQRGDVSLEVIAQRELGDRRLWKVIAEANPFLSPHKLYPGRTVLRIPIDPKNIQGLVVEETTPEPAGGAPITPTAPSAPEATEYTIGSGDTLSGIAKQFYGDPGLWRVIYEANRGTLGDPDRLPRGAKLKIPPKPAGRGG